MIMLQCIICNRIPEVSWPKRWQCWKENGKFSESMCKLLGLPKYPYKADFQNSSYCSACQQRVYNVYLIVRKWDRLQEDISKVKLQLEKDFHHSLRTGEETGAGGGSDREDNNTNNTSGGENSFPDQYFAKWFDTSAESGYNSSSEPKGKTNAVRRRILKRLSRDHRPGCEDCDKSCCRSSSGKETHQTEIRPNIKKLDQNHIIAEEAENSNSSSSSSSSSISGESCDEDDDNNEGKCSCKECYSEKSSAARNKASSCSRDYCVDCSICNHEANSTNSSVVKTKSNNTNNNHKTIATATTNLTNKIEVYEKGKEKVTKMENSNLLPFETISVDQSTTVPKTDYDLKPDLVGGVGRNLAISSTEMPKEVSGNGNQTEKPKDNDASSTKSDDLSKYRARSRCYRVNCSRSFATNEDMEIHIKRHHEGVKCPYVCQSCGKSFQWRRELEAHSLKHSGEFAISCHICGRGFRTKQLYFIHVKSTHSGDRKHKCSYCDKSFITESKLKAHLTIHTKVYPFTCSVCGKGFAAKTFLTFHMTKHMDANPFQCTTCGKGFSSPRYLRVHQYSHSEHQPFRCSVCNTNWATEVSLKMHMLKHNEEKSYSCSTCSKRFRFSASLKKHQKVHEKNQTDFAIKVENTNSPELSDIWKSHMLDMDYSTDNIMSSRPELQALKQEINLDGHEELLQFDGPYFPIPDSISIEDIIGGTEADQIQVNAEQFYSTNELDSLPYEESPQVVQIDNHIETVQAETLTSRQNENSSDPVAFTINSMESPSYQGSIEQIKSELGMFEFQQTG